MTPEQPIRRRPDGSIDTAHYLNRGRALRSEAAHRVPRRAARTSLGALVFWAALVVIFPVIGQG